MKLTLGIFFDGTNNSINDDPQVRTNIAKLYKVYGDGSDPAVQALYVRGVGSKKRQADTDNLSDDGSWANFWEQLLGGAIGKGGHARIKYMQKQVRRVLKKTPGVTSLTIDIFGFSRGAALARHFVNVITENPFVGTQTIRFMGIFDTVGSFGIPGDNKDSFDLSVDKKKVKYVYHLIAENELRRNYDVHSIRANNKVAAHPYDTGFAGRGKHVEILCPGVHADLGGGYRRTKIHGTANNELSRIYLKKMHRVAKSCRVPFVEPTGDDARLWGTVDEASLVKHVQTITSTFEKNPELRIKHAILRNTREYHEIMKRRAKKSPKRRRGKLPNRDQRRWQMEANALKKDAKIMKNLFMQTKFPRITDNQVYLDNYNQFAKKYIHKSHTPHNKLPGMEVQETPAVTNINAWPELAKTHYAGAVQETIKRTTYYNP